MLKQPDTAACIDVCSGAKQGAYVIFEFRNTKRSCCGDWQGEAVLNASLAQPFGSGLSDSATGVTRQRPHPPPHRSDGPARLISSLHRRLPSEGGAESPHWQSRPHLKWALGGAQRARFPWLPTFWQSHRRWLRADSDEAGEASDENNKTSDWLPARISGENVDACQPPKVYRTDKVSRIGTHAHNCGCTWGRGGFRPSALSHTQISITVKVASPPFFCCTVKCFPVLTEMLP